MGKQDGVALQVRNNADRELLRLLKSMPRRVFLRTIRSANAKTSTYLKKHMQAATPVKTGALKRSWGKQTISDAERGEIITVIGIRRQWRDPKTKKIPNKYARRVDEKHPFVDEAFENFIATGLSRYVTAVGDDIDKEAKRKA